MSLSLLSIELKQELMRSLFTKESTNNSINWNSWKTNQFKQNLKTKSDMKEACLNVINDCALLDDVNLALGLAFIGLAIENIKNDTSNDTSELTEIIQNEFMTMHKTAWDILLAKKSLNQQTHSKRLIFLGNLGSCCLTQKNFQH